MPALRRIDRIVCPAEREGERLAHGLRREGDLFERAEVFAVLAAVLRKIILQHAADLDAADHLCRAAHVIPIEVRHDQQIEPPDPARGELAQDLVAEAFLAAVDQHGRIRRLQQDRVRLARVEHRDLQPVEGFVRDRGGRRRPFSHGAARERKEREREKKRKEPPDAV